MAGTDLKNLPIEKSISESSFVDYQTMERRYFEHFYWCPSVKPSNGKSESSDNEPLLIDQIKGMENQSLIHHVNCHDS
jgi:hypothetical protein